MNSDDFEDFPLDMELLMKDAMREILRHENPQKFLAWIKQNFEEYLTFDPIAHTDSSTFHSVATNIGTAIWNATPLPKNGFKPRPLPKPEGAFLCPCGSGKKYQHCCCSIPEIPDIEPAAIWYFMIQALSKKQLQTALQQNAVPGEALVAHTESLLDMGMAEEARSFLEPLFGKKTVPPDIPLDDALNILCNTYDELGMEKKKNTLLKTIIETDSPSSLRSSAYQRLATIRMDAGDAKGAWDAFQSAQHDNPDDMTIGALEVQLLVTESRYSQAQERAGFWLKKIHKETGEADTPLLQFLDAIHKNPESAAALLIMQSEGVAGIELLSWLQSVANREIPVYQTQQSQRREKHHDGKKKITKRGNKQMSLPFNADHTPSAQVGNPPSPLGVQTEEETVAEESGFVLVTPNNIASLEKKWRRVFRQHKPFSVHFGAMSFGDPWGDAEENFWISFLDDHPAAFDSINILDDLLIALEDHPLIEMQVIQDCLLKPIALRVLAIVEKATANSSAPVSLSWDLKENRNALRSLSRLAYYYDDFGSKKEAIQLAEYILRLNPVDNHGFRGQIINHYLQEGEDEKALSLADRYPNDILPDIMYGAVLALFRLGRLDEASDRLTKATAHLGKVYRYLTTDKIKKPALSDGWTQVGGDDQAWLYREMMRDTWNSTPGALKWLKECSRLET